MNEREYLAGLESLWTAVTTKMECFKEHVEQVEQRRFTIAVRDEQVEIESVRRQHPRKVHQRSLQEPIVLLMADWGLTSLLPRGTFTREEGPYQSTIDLVLASTDLIATATIKWWTTEGFGMPTNVELAELRSTRLILTRLLPETGFYFRMTDLYLFRAGAGNISIIFLATTRDFDEGLLPKRKRRSESSQRGKDKDFRAPEPRVQPSLKPTNPPAQDVKAASTFELFKPLTQELERLDEKDPVLAAQVVRLVAV
ncbi:uncharacterized protein KD926_011678 [Aspergillus affinis]|uniref:uncharacterized protein n=1 Tax=Aspergillus affinis TaxID=1070780 RepID=UPI0022FE5881|nr:uncharacterized protein KD926_011678 [Aspergillus affinis]KAI9044708.1 hypothetical protein KD926_011678 [Aspergillus affinis]